MVEKSETPGPTDIFTDPCASYWIKDALQKALNRDPVDAANDAEILAAVLAQRASGVLAEMTEFIKNAKRCGRCNYFIDQQGRCGCVPLEDEAP